MWFRTTGNMPRCSDLTNREKNRGKDNPSGRRCSLATMSSSERESRKLLRCKEGSYWHFASSG